jgi:hypothetical protein
MRDRCGGGQQCYFQGVGSVGCGNHRLQTNQIALGNEEQLLRLLQLASAGLTLLTARLQWNECGASDIKHIFVGKPGG